MAIYGPAAPKPKTRDEMLEEERFQNRPSPLAAAAALGGGGRDPLGLRVTSPGMTPSANVNPLAAQREAQDRATSLVPQGMRYAGPGVGSRPSFDTPRERSVPNGAPEPMLPAAAPVIAAMGTPPASNYDRPSNAAPMFRPAPGRVSTPAPTVDPTIAYRQNLERENQNRLRELQMSNAPRIGTPERAAIAGQIATNRDALHDIAVAARPVAPRGPVQPNDLNVEMAKNLGPQISDLRKRLESGDETARGPLMAAMDRLAMAESGKAFPQNVDRTRQNELVQQGVQRQEGERAAAGQRVATAAGEYEAQQQFQRQMAERAREAGTVQGDLAIATGKADVATQKARGAEAEFASSPEIQMEREKAKIAQAKTQTIQAETANKAAEAENLQTQRQIAEITQNDPQVTKVAARIGSTLQNLGGAGGYLGSDRAGDVGSFATDVAALKSFVAGKPPAEQQRLKADLYATLVQAGVGNTGGLWNWLAGGIDSLGLEGSPAGQRTEINNQWRAATQDLLAFLQSA